MNAEFRNFLKSANRWGQLWFAMLVLALNGLTSPNLSEVMRGVWIVAVAFAVTQIARKAASG